MHEQRSIHAYTKEGLYKGVYVATVEQFAETGLVEGLEPAKVLTKQDVIEAYRRRVRDLINAGTDRKSYAEAIERRAELVVNLFALNGRVAAGEVLSDADETMRQAIIAGSIELARLETVSKQIAALSPIPVGFDDPERWAKP